VDEDTEESGGLLDLVGLELGVDLDDECGGDDGEQTGLYYESTRVTLSARKTHKYESGIQILVVFLDEFSVVLFCFTAVHVVEFHSATPLGCWRVIPPTAQGCKDVSGLHGAGLTHPLAAYPVPYFRSPSLSQALGCNWILEESSVEGTRTLPEPGTLDRGHRIIRIPKVPGPKIATLSEANATG